MPTLLKVYGNNQPNPILCGAVQFVCRQFYILYLQISVCDANSTESVQQQPAQPSTVWSYTVCFSTVLYIIFTDIWMWCQLYWTCTVITSPTQYCVGERGGSVVECQTPEREVRGSRPTAAVLCPWARHFTPRKYWLITQEAMAPSRHDWKIVDWDVKPQHNQPVLCGVVQFFLLTVLYIIFTDICMWCQLFWKCTVITSPTLYCVELYNLFVDSSIY